MDFFPNMRGRFSSSWRAMQIEKMVKEGEKKRNKGEEKENVFFVPETHVSWKRSSIEDCQR
jgi:hypothetical protein